MIATCPATHLQIRPSYSNKGIIPAEHDIFISYIQQRLGHILPSDFLNAIEQKGDPQSLEMHFFKLHHKLPLLIANNPSEVPSTLSVTLLCHSDFTEGVGRYLCDVMARWLVPGKFLNISSARSLNFHFVAYPQKHFFFHQLFLDVRTEQALKFIQHHWETLKREVCLTILAVRHARTVVSLKKLSTQEKKTLIEKNISSVIPIPSTTLEPSIFNQMHNFWLHLSAEDRMRQIQEQFTPHIEQRPKIFDASIFHDIKRVILLVGEKFAGQRDVRHISRLISYQYLFRKMLMRRIPEAPEERHVHLKLLKTQSPSSPQHAILGILGAMNVLRENELFEERHIVEAISHCLPHVRILSNSFILDRSSHDPIRLFYLEIEKNSEDCFSIEEIKELKKNLPHQLKENVESVLHPVLIPRNEEEIMRNILLLSQQLKYLSDMPQVLISFNAQTEGYLQFTVILLRILRGEDLSVSEIFTSSKTELKIEELEVKNVGLLRKRYPKESNVFKICLDKRKYLRKDFTIDLFKARQELSQELSNIFQGIRDFNGGILSKQHEVFQQFRTLIDEPSVQKDFLLENFFYSITPPLRQSLIPPATLRDLFGLMQEAFTATYEQESFFLKNIFEENQLLVMAASPCTCFKEELCSLLTNLKIPSSELSCTSVNSQGICSMGYIYQNRDPAMRTLFYSTLHSYLKEWEARRKIKD